MLAPRQQPLLFVVVRTTLKVMVVLAAIAGLLAFVSIFTGCAQTEVSPKGFKTFNTNMTQVSWTPTSFHADSINASTPLNSMWRGINRETDILKDLGLGLGGPTCALPVAVRGAGILGTKLSNPTQAKPGD